jgi:hypothetical protein
MDWRIKYYGLQAVAFAVTMFLIAVGFGLTIWLDSDWPIWIVLPIGALISGGAWLLAQGFAPHSGKHLTPREWEELRGALEDVEVMSVFHIVSVDKRALERFKYLPLLKRYLWECMAEEEIDGARVVRAAFLLHTFGEDLREYSDAIVLIPDPVVQAWFSDIIAERRGLRRRDALREEMPRVRTLLRQMAQEPEDGSDVDPTMEAAWRLLLFGPLAHQELRHGLADKDPKVREACLALLELQTAWPERKQDLEERLRRDLHPSVQHAAMELLAMDGRAAIPVLQEAAADPFLAGRAGELLKELDGRR